MWEDSESDDIQILSDDENLVNVQQQEIDGNQLFADITGSPQSPQLSEVSGLSVESLRVDNEEESNFKKIEKADNTLGFQHVFNINNWYKLLRLFKLSTFKDFSNENVTILKKPPYFPPTK